MRAVVHRKIVVITGTAATAACSCRRLSAEAGALADVVQFVLLSTAVIRGAASSGIGLILRKRRRRRVGIVVGHGTAATAACRRLLSTASA